MKTNHWGITVDSEIIITGVVSNNTPEWLNEEICNGINLQYEDYIASAEGTEGQDHESYTDDQDHESYEADPELEHDFMEYESQPSDTILIGAWIKGPDGKYEPDPEGEYSAICGEVYTQIVQSKFTKRTALCSPCYPGQGDLDTPGDWLAYDLPADIYGVQSNE